MFEKNRMKQNKTGQLERSLWVIFKINDRVYGYFLFIRLTINKRNNCPRSLLSVLCESRRQDIKYVAVLSCKHNIQVMSQG